MLASLYWDLLLLFLQTLGCPTLSVTIHLFAKVTVLLSLQSSWVLLIWQFSLAGNSCRSLSDTCRMISSPSEGVSSLKSSGISISTFVVDSVEMLWSSIGVSIWGRFKSFSRLLSVEYVVNYYIYYIHTCICVDIYVNTLFKIMNFWKR